ncbi:hypothetical protein B0H14DRAFT_3454598 [Mycena olivaceomarginata]|nr:hypothetical protein B0H14DRAFT_3454598 [Mycena olivaceomarginata]
MPAAYDKELKIGARLLRTDHQVFLNALMIFFACPKSPAELDRLAAQLNECRCDLSLVVLRAPSLFYRSTKPTSILYFIETLFPHYPSLVNSVGKDADFWGVLVEELESCAEIFHTDPIIAGNVFREGTAYASI